MTCPHCQSEDTYQIVDRTFCRKCYKPLLSVINCSRCGKEIPADDDKEDGYSTIIKSCPECYAIEECNTNEE